MPGYRSNQRKFYILFYSGYLGLLADCSLDFFTACFVNSISRFSLAKDWFNFLIVIAVLGFTDFPVTLFTLVAIVFPSSNSMLAIAGLTP